MSMAEASPVIAGRPAHPVAPLFELIHLPSKLILDSVFLNGLHALRRFEVKNISPYNLTIKLRSNLGSQIAFQLTNENLPDRESRPNSRNQFHRELSSVSLSSSIESISQADAESSAEGAESSYPASPEPDLPTSFAAQPVATNTVAAAAMGTFGAEHNALHGHQFNQLFNYVNHIDELKIAPGNSQKVILAFLPDSPGRGRRNPEKDGQLSERDAKLDHTRNEEETYDFFEVNGLLFFFAYKTADATSEAESGTLKASEDHASNSTEGGSVATALGWKARSGTPANRDLDDAISPTTQSAPDHQVNVKFRSRVCRSVLWTDIGDTGMAFDDCVVGGTYFKDFTVWNRSEVELYWHLNMVDPSSKQDSSWLKLTDYDTGVPLDGKPIASYSPRRIRITFRPREMGEFAYDLQLENANDSSNTVEATIHAVVRSALREESLVVSSGNVMDFGECATGLWAKQRLVLRNVSESPIEISFTADVPSVVFQLKSEELTHSNLPILAPTVAEAGERLFDKLRELSFSRPNHGSDTSYPPSAGSSRPSSPSFMRKGSEVINVGSSSTDLASLIAAAATAAPDSNEENDSEDSDHAEATKEGVGSNGEEYRRIEEIVLRPGTERIVEVCYRPERDAPTLDHRGGRLTRRNFRLFLAYASMGVTVKEKKTIQCKARTCTSFIEVSPTVVNFGDTDVGTLKSAPIQITNCSDLPARVELRFVSKVLNTYRDEIVIPPKQSIEAKVDIYPRKVNPEYRKQVSVVNLLNRENNQAVEIRSTNIDKNRVTFHSLFYRILTPKSSNFIDFGSVVINSAAARTLTIANISKKRLILEIASSLPKEIKIYTRGRPSSPTVIDPAHQNLTTSTVERRERLLESISDRRKIPRPDSINASATPPITKTGVPMPKLRSFPEVTDSSPADYLDLASSVAHTDGRRSPRRRTVQHYPFNTLKQLHAQFRDVKMASADEEISSTRSGRSIASGHPNGAGSSGAGRNPFLSDDAGDDSSVKGDGDLDADQLTKSLDLALRTATEARNRSANAMNEVTDSTKLPLNTLLSMLESVTGIAPPPLPKLSAEEQYIRARLHLTRELDTAIKDGRLIPITVVEIPPESDLPILLVLTPEADKPHVQNKARKMDSRVYLKLLEFDRDIEQPQFEQLLQGDQEMIPVRELLLRSSLSRSVMELNQKNINFGSMDKNEHRTKSIVIRNNSEAPLLYAIRKSGSIASGDLILGDGRMGVIRAYGMREVEFMFDPSLAGPFHERFSIENIQDRSNDQSISVKATIRKPAPFTIECSSVDFGACLINEIAPVVQHVVISNTSFKKTRTFEVRVDPEELRFKGFMASFAFDLVDKDDDYVEEDNGTDDPGEPKRRRRRPLLMLSKEMEEEIEHLEQKLKIAKRKGHKDKVKKVIDKLDKLRAGIVDDDYAEEEADVKAKDKSKGKDGVIGSEGNGRVNGDETPKANSDGIPVLSDTPIRAAFDGPSESPVSSSFDASRRTSQLNVGPEVVGDASLVPGISVPFKPRKTEFSIVFALEPRTIRTVAVHFRPLEIATCSEINSSEANGNADNLLFPGVELATTSLYVHEHKNTDITKEVPLRALVCYNQETYLRAVSEENKQNPSYRNGPENSMPATAYRMADEASLDSRSPSPLLQSKSGVFSGSCSPALTPQMHGTQPALNGNSVQTGDGAAPLALPSMDPLPTMELMPSLVVEVPMIELGNIKIHERKDCYFTLANRSTLSLPYSIVPTKSDQMFATLELSGTLAASETKRIDVHFTPTSLGRQSFLVTLDSQSGGQPCTVTLSAYVVAKAYLAFPGLPEPRAVAQDLDFGFCYLDTKRKFARVIPYDLENISDDVIFVSAVSNLVQQCFIFADQGMEAPATDIRIGYGEKTTIYIGLQPYLSSSGRRGAGTSGGTKSSNIPGSGPPALPAATSGNEDFRTLVGGIKFMVQKKEQVALAPLSTAQVLPLDDSTKIEVESSSFELYNVMTYTAKFTAIIGQSMLSVSDTLVDLGLVNSIGSVHSGSFTVCNLSSRMPLEFKVEPSPGVELENHSGKLEGRTDMDPQIDVLPAAGRVSDTTGCPPASCERIKFRMKCTEYGLLSKFIEVVNVNNASQRVRVEIRLFADMGRLAVEGAFAPSETGKLPLLLWDGAYLDIAEGPCQSTVGSGTSVLATAIVSSPAGSGANPDDATSASTLRLLAPLGHGELIGPYRKQIRIINRSNEAIRMFPASNLDLAVTWEDDPTSPTEQNPLSAGVGGICKQCGAARSLKPGEVAVAEITIPEPSFGDLVDQALSSLLAGDKATLNGILCFEDMDRNVVAKTIEVIASFCVSKGEVEPAAFDVGKVGHYNSWNDVEVKFAIKNLSDIPLLYALDLPPAIETIEESKGVAIREVPSRESWFFEGILKPRLLDLTAVGPRTLDVVFRNLINPANTVTVAVTTNLTLFELRFDRLVSGELILPPLTHPHLPTALPCDTWFAIVNTSDDDMKFEVGFTPAADVSDFVRFDVLSRFSNSPLVGSVSLTPLGLVEVKVRACARENSRLPINSPDARWLTNPEGLTFGTLWITPKYQHVEGESEGRTNKVTEHIPIKGVIVEGPTFTLSEKQVNFRTFSASDSEGESGSNVDKAEARKQSILQTEVVRKSEDGLLQQPQTNAACLPSQKEQVYVTNLSANFELEFKVTFEYPLELPNGTSLLRASPLNDEMVGRVAPGERFPLVLELLNPSIGGVSDDIKVLIHDVNSVSRHPQILYVSIVEDTSGNLHRQTDEKDHDPPENLFLSDSGTQDSGNRDVSISGKPHVDEPGSSIEEDEELLLVDGPLAINPSRDVERSLTNSSSRPSTLEAGASTMMPSHNGRRPAGLLALRGCKRVSDPQSGGGGDLEGLYELDLGQQDLGANIASKKLSLENPTADRISYRIRTLSETDKVWLSFGRTEGTLEGNRPAAGGGGVTRDVHPISINLSTNARGVYTTYIFVDNLDNPADMKTIRVSMEIVARQNVRRTAAGVLNYSGSVAAGMPIEPSSNHVFDVYVHGADASVNAIIMDHLYFESEYAARSMIICNRESVPLEFTFNSSLTREDDTELLFSLSRSTARLFRSITVEPESQARVYIRLRPSAECISTNESSGNKQQSQQQSAQNQFPTTLAMADQPLEKNIEIYVNCRLVKDFQKIISLRATCRQPQMLLSHMEFSFRGVMRRKGPGGEIASTRDEDIWSLHLMPSTAEVEVANLLTDPLECWAMNDTMYFHIEGVDTPRKGDANSLPATPVKDLLGARGSLSLQDTTGDNVKHRRQLCLGIAPQKSAGVRIVPNMEALLKHADKLRGEKYVVEHLTFYNRKRPREKTFVVLKLSLGHMTEFQSASGSRHSYAAIENHIIKLLRDLDTQPDSIGASEPGSGAVVDASEPYFRYVYIVDQLVYYGTREHAAENYAHLAQLLFSTLFAKPIFRDQAPASLVAGLTPEDGRCWPPALAKWLSYFIYFMDFFPYRWPALEPLRDMIRMLLKPTETTPTN